MGGFVGVYFLSKKIIDDNHSERLWGVLATFLGAVVVGYLYGVLKLLVGAHVGMKSDKSRGCIKFLFLDALVKEIVEHLEGSGKAAPKQN